MATKSGVKSMEQIVANLKAAVNESRRPDIFKHLGEFSIKLITRRTRLGYGVDEFLAPKRRLKPLSEKYVKQRSKSRLSSFTSPKRSNLTRSAQMIDSLKIIRQTKSSVVIGPTGNRKEDSTITNQEIAQYNAENGRSFMQLSDLEYAQVFREYRRKFGDLLNKRRLLK